MRKTSIYLLVATTLIFYLMTCSIVVGLPNSSVTLVSTGSISRARAVSAYGSYAYTLAYNATSSYVIAHNGTIVYSNSNKATAFYQATIIANKSSLYIRNGTWTTSASTGFQMGLFSPNVKLVKENVTFDPNSLMTITNSLNPPSVLAAQNCYNCTITGINVNGNAANQLTSTNAVTNGLEVNDCSNLTVRNSHITNTARDGLEIDTDMTGLVGSEIKNSTFTFCGWNGMTLGGGNPDAIGEYAINNTVAYCGDVGITNYGVGDIVENNYIHNMNGTTNTGANWGIAVEGNGYDLIVNNKVVNCTQGVNLEGKSSLIINNNFTADVEGVVDSGNSDTIVRNKITNWGTGARAEASGWAFGIYLESSQNAIVAFNTLKSSNTTLANGIYCDEATNSAIFNNTVTTLTSASSYGIYAESGSSNIVAKWNKIQAEYGIEIIGSSCTDNTLVSNNLNNCTTQTTNTGTGTRINPTSSATYTLTINSANQASSTSGRYSYSNSTVVIITLSGNSPVLNIDGSNVSLTNNQYSLVMSSDHIAYTTSSLVSVLP